MSITSNIANVASALTTGTEVNNLNAELLNGQTGSYYTNYINEANTNNLIYTNNAINSNVTILQGLNSTQNTRLSAVEIANDTQNTNISNLTSWLSSNNSLQSGVNSAQNTSISSAFTQSNSAFAAANTKLSLSGGDITGSVSVSGNIVANTEISYQANTSVYPDIRPSLLLDFANAKTLDPRITFSRASTATYYDGKTVAKAEENLLTYSQEFANWSQLRATTASNVAAAPDGTTTADEIFDGTETNTHYVRLSGFSVTTVNDTFIVSIFAKANTINSIELRLGDSALEGVVFSLSTGTVSSAGSNTGGQTITDFGSGWYRCSFSVTGTDANSNLLYVFLNGGAFYQGSDGSIYLWGAQLEQRSSITAYTPTTTQPVTNYIPVLQTAAAGIPRFDHNPVTGESLGFLIEEQRTNLLTYSEDFSTDWYNSSSSEIVNCTVAPDGTLTADKIIDGTSNSAHWVYKNLTLTSGTIYTISYFVKKAENKFTIIRYGGSLAAVFNLETGAVVSNNLTSVSIQSVGNDWYRCSGTFTGNGINTPTGFSSSSLGGNYPYTGDGYSGIYIWGAQLEAGAFATSYIPTAASQVTRSADAASMTGTNFSSWFRQDQGTMYVQGLGKTRFLAMQIGALRFMDIAWTSTTAVGSYSNNTPSGYLTIKTGIDQNSPVSVALSYASQDWASAYNGTAGGTGGQLTDINPDNLRIGNYQNTEYLNGTIKRIAYYPKRLTNEQLIAITS